MSVADRRGALRRRVAMGLTVGAAAITALCATAAMAQMTDNDSSALDLADGTAQTTHKARDWRAFIEGAVGGVRRRDADAAPATQRLSAGFALDTRLGGGVRLVFDDRLDIGWNQVSGRTTVNTLKDAYLSWQANDQTALDVGRVKTRQGVASGYNPTDYFRAGALRTIVSSDPASLRENRQGTGMIRGQRLWSDGSLTGIVAPKLDSTPSSAPFNADFGSTNAQSQWLLIASQRLSKSLDPQWLLKGGPGQSPQLGLNLSGLINDSTIAYVEWSGGRSRSLLSRALMAADDTRWRNQLATGLTKSFANKLSLTAEYHYDGAALDAAGWRGLAGSPSGYGRYRGYVANQQELPTRQALFFYATVQDIGWQHLDLTAMLRHDLVDRSQMFWLEGRYHFDRAELALQFMVNRGDPGSNYGAAPQRRSLQLVWRAFL